MSHIHIDIEKLSFGYEEKNVIFNEFDLHLKENDSVGLIGANGAGKSTLLKLLVGLEAITAGSIRVEEIPVEKNTIAKN